MFKATISIFSTCVIYNEREITLDLRNISVLTFILPLSYFDKFVISFMNFI